jgi:hypothetical protein
MPGGSNSIPRTKKATGVAVGNTRERQKMKGYSSFKREVDEDADGGRKTN